MWAAGCRGWARVNAHGGIVGWKYTAQWDARPRRRHRGTSLQGTRVEGEPQAGKGLQSRETHREALTCNTSASSTHGYGKESLAQQ